LRKTKPIQTQYKANSNPIKAKTKPKQTQFQRRKNQAFFECEFAQQDKISVSGVIYSMLQAKKFQVAESLPFT